MPEIPMYEQQTSAAGSVNVRANPDDFGAQVSQAGSNVAVAVKQLSEGMQARDRADAAVLKEQNERVARSWAGSAASQAMLDMTEELNTRKAAAPAGAPNFTPGVLDSFDTYSAKLIQSAPTDTAKQYLTDHMSQLRAHVGQQALEFQANAMRGQQVDNANQTMDNLAKVTAQDPTQYDASLAVIDAQVQTLPADIGQKVRERAVATLSAAAADKVLATNPAALYKLTGRALNIPEPATAPATVAPPATGGGAFAEAQAASAAAADDPARIPVLRDEMNLSETTPASRAALGAEIDRISRLSPLTPQQPAAVAGPTPPPISDHDLGDGKPLTTGVSFVDKASLPQLLEWRQQARTEMDRVGSAQRTVLDARAKDFQAMVLAGVTPPANSVPTFAEYSTAFGDQAPQRYAADVDTYVRLQGGLAQLQGASYADRQAALARYTPTPGAGFEEQQRIQGSLAQANALIEKRIVTDPAAYALQTAPKVQQAYAMMQVALADKNMPAAQREAAIDAYALVSTSEQERVGVRSIKGDVLGEGGAARQLAPRLLTNGEANSIAQQFHTTGANAAQLMDSLQQQWGAHFPQVFEQLAQDNKLPPAAMVIPNMSDPYAKETLARYSDPKLQKQMIENLPAGSMKDINTSLQQANEPFFTSLAFQQGGQRTYDTVLEQQRVLAGSYVMQGRSASDAARIAYEQTVGHQYVFADSLRIPKSEQPDLVQSGLGTLQMAPEALHASPPPSYRPGLTPKDRNVAWLDAIKSNATWVANGDESGATLVVRGRTDTGADVRYPVPGPDGKTPLSWSWAQLRAIGMDRHAKARALVDSAEPAPSLSGGGF
jgi:hypothetical protein